jgi:hypothetical protein
MKKLLSFVFVFVSLISVSQSDTIYLLKNKKVACKILEISDLEIKYRAAGNMDGPLYIIDKNSVTKYTLSNGFTEQIAKDELSIENEHREILGNRQVIKFSPFSFAFSHLSFAYESVIKVGMNLDVEAGYINSEINPDGANLIRTGGYNNSIHNSGVFFKPGVKFFLGEDFSVKGLKYAHPLKGRYIKLDLAVSYINFEDMSMVHYNYNNGAPTTNTVYTDMNTVAYGGFVNYGRQFILGNILTLDYYVGVGFTGQSETYSNPDFFNTQNNNNYYQMERRNYTANYHGFLRVPTLGLSFTGGFRIGYIIPQKSANKKPIKQ